jgi:hypothetical protein
LHVRVASRTKRKQRRRARVVEPQPQVIITKGPDGLRIDVLTERRPPLRARC